MCTLSVRSANASANVRDKRTRDSNVLEYVCRSVYGCVFVCVCGHQQLLSN